jgi:mRNA interferase MazF
MVDNPVYVPACGDVIWIDLSPQSGHEQSGRRPAVVLSPKNYNEKTGLVIMCPVTSKIKGYPFEVVIPVDFPVNGAILSDQVKSLDWRVRNAEYILSLPEAIISTVLKKLALLLSF